jgi:hypothetical protein
MMTQSVMTQAANLFGNAAGSVTSKGKQTGTGFDQIIDNSLKSVQDGQDKTITVKDTPVKKDAANNDNPSDELNEPDGQKAVEKTVKTAKNESSKATEQTADKQTEKVSDTAKPKEAGAAETDEVSVSEQVMAQFTDMLHRICEIFIG